MKTKLVLLDGIPGTGKSTAAHFLARQLTRNDRSAKWFHEYEDANPLFDINAVENKSIDDPVNYISQTLDKWKKLVAKLSESDKIYIIESYLFQSTVGYLFFNDIKLDLIENYVQEVTSIIAGLEPIVIYFRPESPEKSLQRLRELRGEEWVNRCVTEDCNLPYAVSRDFQKVEGWYQMYSDYLQLTDRVFSSFNFKKIQLDNLKFDLNSIQKQLLVFFSLKLIKDKELSIEQQQKFIGNYRYKHSKRYFSIRFEKNSLYLHDCFSYPLKLLSTKENAFVAESTPHEFFFHENEEGNIFKVTHDGSAMFEGEVYTIIKKQTFAPSKFGKLIHYFDDTFDDLLENALVYAYDFNKYNYSVELFQRAFEEREATIRQKVLYANVLSLAGKGDLLFEILEKLSEEIENSKWFLEWVNSDPDLRNARADNRYTFFVSKLESKLTSK